MFCEVQEFEVLCGCWIPWGDPVLQLWAHVAAALLPVLSPQLSS